MKKRIIAINAICKNEMQRIAKWLDLVSTADYICVLDTGSTDGTWEYIKDYAAQHPDKCFVDQSIITPRRFDVARNESMKLVPEDVEVFWSLDIDEFPIEGWRDIIDNEWEDDLDVLNYKFTYGNKVTNETSVIWCDKIRSNVKNWKRIYPIHEKCSFIASKTMKAKYAAFDDILLYHHQHTNMSKSAYLKLIRMRAEEDKYNLDLLSSLLSELFTRQHYAELIETTTKWLIPLLLKNEHCKCTEEERRAYLQNAYLRTASAYRSMDRHTPDIEKYYHLAIKADPTILSSYTNMADWLIEDRNNPYQAIEVVKTAMKIKISRYDMKDSLAQRKYIVWDLLARAYYKIGAYEEALFCSGKALLNIEEKHTEYWRIKNHYELILNADNAWKKMMMSWGQEK